MQFGVRPCQIGYDYARAVCAGFPDTGKGINGLRSPACAFSIFPAGRHAKAGANS